MTIQSIDTDFDDWVIATYGEVGSFTLLIVLVRIDETTVTLLSSSYLHVVGDQVRWPQMVELFAGAGVDWSGAVFFRAGREGLVEDALARSRLSALARKLVEDRLLIREGEFFNRDGLRLAIEETPRH